MIHVVDSNGNIVAQITEGSDTSWYKDQGYQVITKAKEVDDITQWVYVDDKLQEIGEDIKLQQAKEEALANLRAVINAFVETKPDGKVRYDTTLKLNLTRAVLNALVNGTTPPAAVTAVEDWLAAIQSEYFNFKKQILDATTIDEIPQVTYDYFEEKYGVKGTVKPDPDVYTEDLV